MLSNAEAKPEERREIVKKYKLAQATYLEKRLEIKSLPIAYGDAASLPAEDG